MAKSIDKNGYWFIPHNPISKVGIFDYLGSSISDECEPNKIYKVFRPGDTLLNSVPTWDNPPKPFINDHEMLGEGFTEIDDRPVQGVITNPQYEDGVLYADITVYSEKLKEAIENGKKELSLGYFCKFEKQPGIYEGEAYDYIQTNMVGNHIALVDAGRCGSDVKVFDQKCVMDSFDIVSKDEDLKKTENLANITNEQETETKDDAMADKREFIRKIMAIAAKGNDEFEGGEQEKIETIAKLLEESEYAKSEKGTANDEEAKKDDGEEKAEDKCGKDEDEEKKSEDESEEKESEDEDDDEKKAEDAQLSLLKKIADGIDELLKKSEDEEKKDEEKAEDEDEEKKSEDEDEEKKSEDEDDDSKEAGDGVLFTFGQDKAIDGEDPAIKAYLA